MLPKGSSTKWGQCQYWGEGRDGRVLSAELAYPDNRTAQDLTYYKTCDVYFCLKGNTQRGFLNAWNCS